MPNNSAACLLKKIVISTYVHFNKPEILQIFLIFLNDVY